MSEATTLTTKADIKITKVEIDYEDFSLTISGRVWADCPYWKDSTSVGMLHSAFKQVLTIDSELGIQIQETIERYFSKRNKSNETTHP